MNDERKAKKIYDGKVSGKRGRGRGTSVDLKEVCRDRSVWHSVLSDYPDRDKA